MRPPGEPPLEDPPQPGDPLRDETLSQAAAADVQVVVKGGAVQIVGQYSQQLLSFALSSIAVRVLGKAVYGIYLQVARVLAIGGQLGLAGFNYASMRFISRARAAKDHGAVRGSARVGLTGSAIASGIVFTALMIWARPLAELFADHPSDAPDLARYFRIGAAYIPLFAFMQTLRYCTQAYKTMLPSVIVGNIVQPVTRFLIGVVVLATSATVAGLTLSLVVATGVGALAGAFYFQRMLTLEERRAAPKANTGGMVRFALPQAGSSLLGIQSLGLGVIVLGLYSTDGQVGIFGVALALQSAGTVFLGGIVNIWAPVVSDLHEKGEIARLGSLYQTINRWIATFSFPVFAALIIEHDLWARIYGGSDAVAAGTVAALLAVGNLVYTGTGPTGYVISMTGRPGVNFANSLVAVGLYFGLGAWAASEHGAVGVAVVDLGVTAAVNLVRVLEAWLLVGVQPFGRSFLKPVLATLAGAAVLVASKPLTDGDTWMTFVGVAVAAVTYLGVLRALGLDPEETHVWNRIKARALKGRKGRRAS
ncbi:MAG TPA: oligosaccharide flippase family protein [Actinomycetota bacterium]